MNFAKPFRVPELARLYPAEGNSDFPLQSRSSPAMVLRSCLIDLGLVQYPGANTVSETWPCYVSDLPNETNQAVRLKDVAGRNFGRRARDKKIRINYGVSIVVRALDFQTAWSQAQQMAEKIDTSTSPIITQLPEDGSMHYIDNVIRTTQVMDLGEEVNKKTQLVSFNVLIVFDDQEPTIG